MESYGCGFAPTLDEKDSAKSKIEEEKNTKKRGQFNVGAFVLFFRWLICGIFSEVIIIAQVKL